MKKCIIIALCCLSMLTSTCASACGTYVLIYDSDERLLFEEEVRGYHYDTLGYAMNEILARHGYHFKQDGEYQRHFKSIDYLYAHSTGFGYKEAPQAISNEEIIAGLSDIEYENLQLIKKIRTEKRTASDESGYYADWGCSEYPYELYFNTVGNTTHADLPINLKIPVYSGPGEQYLRGANNRAMVSTNEAVMAYGFDGDWLMISFLVNPETKQTRVGYIHKDEFRRELNCPECREALISGMDDFASCDSFFFEKPMSFLNAPKVLNADTVLTDDPAGARTPLANLKIGDKVTLLMTFPEDEQENTDGVPGGWVYIEANTDTAPARGFVPADVLL